MHLWLSDWEAPVKEVFGQFVTDVLIHEEVRVPRGL